MTQQTARYGQAHQPHLNARLVLQGLQGVFPLLVLSCAVQCDHAFSGPPPFTQGRVNVSSCLPDFSADFAATGTAQSAGMCTHTPPFTHMPMSNHMASAEWQACPVQGGARTQDWAWGGAAQVTCVHPPALAGLASDLSPGCCGRRQDAGAERAAARHWRGGRALCGCVHQHGGAGPGGPVGVQAAGVSDARSRVELPDEWFVICKTAVKDMVTKPPLMPEPQSAAGAYRGAPWLCCLATPRRLSTVRIDGATSVDGRQIIVDNFNKLK